jgi:ribosomal protein S18 acetylase RimI-like enzyme
MVESNHTVEMRVKGRWVTVPAMGVNGDKLVTRGKWLKIARVRGEEMKEEELENPELYLAALKRDTNRILKADIFSFTQKLPATRPNYPYAVEWESIAAINLTSYKQWWEGLPQETRKNVRRSQKRGVVIKVTAFDEGLIEGLRAVNDDSPMRQGMKNAYYGLTSDETRERYGEFVGRCDFICAYSGEEMIGFLHLVYRRDIASILNLTTKPSHFDKRPANALMARAVEICEARGITHISYGLYNYGNKRDSSLREFKIRNGFVEFLVPRYFVPISLWGRLCMKGKFHRGLIGTLPSSVIAVALRARELWYNLKVFQRRCSSMPERSNCNRQMGCSNPPAGSNL